MPSAPEHAERLAESWMKLPSESRERLMYIWLDRGVRVHAAKAFDLLGHASVATSLRELGEISTEAGCAEAAKTLSASFGPTDIFAQAATSTLTGIFGVLATLDPKAATGVGMSEGPRPDAQMFGVCVGIVTAARCIGSGAEEERAEIADVAAASSFFA